MAKLSNVKLIDVNDGRVLKVSYEGVNYVKSHTGDVKEGDLLQRDFRGTDLTEGGFYKALADGSREALITDDVGDLARRKTLYFTVFCKEEARLEIGDYAVVIKNNSCHDYEIGSTVKIAYDDQDGTPFRATTVEGELLNYLKESDLRHATPQEIEAYQKAIKSIEWRKIGRTYGQLKAGDIVKVTDNCSAPLAAGSLQEVTVDSRIGMALIGEWSVSAELIAPVGGRLNA